MSMAKHVFRRVGWLVLLAASQCVLARDMMDPLATANAFSAALRAGDEATVKNLLAPGTLIYESGSQDTVTPITTTRMLP